MRVGVKVAVAVKVAVGVSVFVAVGWGVAVGASVPNAPQADSKTLKTKTVSAFVLIIRWVFMYISSSYNLINICFDARIKLFEESIAHLARTQTASCSHYKQRRFLELLIM